MPVFKGKIVVFRESGKTIVLLNYSRDPVYYRGDRVTMLVASATRGPKLKKPDSSLDLNEKSMARK
jgi:hypothetical protein